VTRITDKVVAYITRNQQLLVFRHVHFPEAGIQVPAGTVEPGEPLPAAVLREAREETGLEGLPIRAFLGTRESTVGGDAVRRHFFHLTWQGSGPDRWRHHELDPSDGSPAPIEFELYWVDYPGAVPELAGGQGELLHALVRDGIRDAPKTHLPGRTGSPSEDWRPRSHLVLDASQEGEHSASA